ncbi:phage holin family protein [Cohnella thailandensis]|uniref:Phage holin family protein n=1 Tax=Cohnella thailandensis TaxID=557557 RepID=A0A841SN36_9BACL|nr:phage holin family protein [Cohnella thailandensis]
MIVDYITDVAGAIRTKTLNSDVMHWVIIRKVTVLFAVVLAAAMLDDWILATAMLRTGQQTAARSSGRRQYSSTLAAKAYP